MKVFAVVIPLLATGCGRYADFTLPPAQGEQARTFRWEANAEPVLSRGGAGEWDGVDALNPAVVRRDGLYYNFYSGFDGKMWHTGLATSPDGERWTKLGKVLSPEGWEGDYISATNGSALLVNGEFYYWYQAGRPLNIALARSRDGRTWRRHGLPVLQAGPRGSWDERGVADPYVLRVGDYFYLYYLGEDRARRQRLGVARSRDGVGWEKLRSNPVMPEDRLGEPAVWSSHGAYWMLFTERERDERRHLGLARSRDGVRWERLAVFHGDQPWNSHVICDAEVEVRGDAVRVWFGGGNVAHPVERINGQIGLATLKPSRELQPSRDREGAVQ